MKNIKLIAALVFLTGFWGAGQTAAQHGEHSTASAAADTANGPVAVKELKTKDDGKMKGEKVKAALQKYNCLLCHKYKGKGGKVGPALDGHLKHHSNEELKKLLKNPKQPMPPFPGTDKELEEFVETINHKTASGSGVGGKPGVKRVFKTYVCPMGEYQSSKPGKCPKCGMELIEKKR